MAIEPLVDTYGRVHRDLRISVTDRCNFRCQYCMPAEGMEWMPREELLTFEEIEQVARVLVERYGIDSIRLTGGEPTIRAKLPVLISKLAALDVDLSITTNGATLASQAQLLKGRLASSASISRSTRSIANDLSISLAATICTGCLRASMQQWQQALSQ